MPVDEGGRSNYSQAFRSNELVFIDRSDPEHDTVHSIPASLLKPGKRIEVPDTPLSIRTVRYFPNSNVGRAQAPVADNLADQGVAVKMNVVATPTEVVYAENEINTATAYVEVSGPEGVIGTWLVSNVIDERFPPQTVALDGESWEIALRFTRHYYPFEIELIDFKHEKYPGTEIPYNFSSEVMVHHEDESKDKKALIYMNHPLRYEGLTFYQASFVQEQNAEASVLAVVKNAGRVFPYLSSIVMCVGLLVHIGIRLPGLLRRSK